MTTPGAAEHPYAEFIALMDRAEATDLPDDAESLSVRLRARVLAGEDCSAQDVLDICEALQRERAGEG